MLLRRFMCQLSKREKEGGGGGREGGRESEKWGERGSEGEGEESK